MFERYTEKARRAVFFALYEASQYGSPYIETEHLLLGLLREDRGFARKFLGQGMALEQVRTEIERLMVRRERIPTSVELPLTDDSKKILFLAAEESARLGHQSVGTEHILLGMLNVGGSLAAQLLQARGVKAADVRVMLAEISRPARVKERQDGQAKLTLDRFLTALRSNNAADLIKVFASNALVIDVFGKQWNRDEIFKGFEALFAPYAKKNAASVIDQILADENGFFAANVLWKNAVLASMERIWMHRMSVVLTREGEGWRILLMQVTAIQPAKD